MKAIICIALSLGFSSFSAKSGEIIKRQVQYGKSDKVSTQYVYQSDKRKSKSSSRSSSRVYRPVRSTGAAYYYTPLRPAAACYRPCPQYVGPSYFRLGCTSIRITRSR